MSKAETILSQVIEEISMGPFGSDITIDNYISSGVPVLNGSNLDKFKLTESSFKYVSEEKAKTFRKAIAQRGDIVITHRGTLGQVSYIPENSKFEKYVISQSQFRVKFNKSIDPRYMVYLFHSKYGQKKLLSFKNHVGVPALAQATTNFRSLSLRIHEINEQRRIANVITFIEDKIELNSRINAALEAMAKTLYDYWFVQFDFPNAKGKPYKSSGGKMVWNEELKREVPAGWEVKTFGGYAEVKKGDLITAKDSKEGNVKVVAAGISFSYTHSESNRPKNTITISGSGANAGFINFWREPIFASDCITVRGKGDADTLLLLYHLKFVQNHILNQATGSAQPHVYPSDIKILNYTIPSYSLIQEFGRNIIPMNNKVANNLIENQKLAELRDWLLPMLMNGQVQVG